MKEKVRNVFVEGKNRTNRYDSKENEKNDHDELTLNAFTLRVVLQVPFTTSSQGDQTKTSNVEQTNDGGDLVAQKFLDNFELKFLHVFLCSLYLP